MSTENLQTAVLGGGCFWCVEAAYERIDGVYQVISGYAGGHTVNPTYQEVVSGRTGHAEVTMIYFDPEQISFNEILSLFWKVHDPTTLNRQGADVGTQYRSIILTADAEQDRIARQSVVRIQNEFADPIVTVIEPLETFYPAEDYHQDYYDKNPYAGYCRAVIAPKLNKMGLFAEPRELP